MRPTRAQWKEMVLQLREVRGMGVVTGMRLPDGSLWGSYRSAKREVLVNLPRDPGELAWRGKPCMPKAVRSGDWNSRTRRWSWQ